MTIEQQLHLNKLSRFEKWLKDRTIIEARDYQQFVVDKLSSLTRQLSVPVDNPSWGPRPAAGGDGRTAAPAALIDHNLEFSERIRRYAPLFLAAVVIGVAVMLGALSVDFLILNEFWTRAMFPDFARDLAENFGGSAFAKSLQVVFAAVAFHFFLSSLGPGGRKVFVAVLFVVALAVVLGLGVLNAAVTGPASIAQPAPSDGLGSLLEGLGVETPDQAAPAATHEKQSFRQAVQQKFENVEAVLWIIIPSVIFLVVTGIAALSLRLAETNLTNLVRSQDWRSRRRKLREFEEMQLLQALIDRLVGESVDASGNAAVSEAEEDANVVAFPN